MPQTIQDVAPSLIAHETALRIDLFGFGPLFLQVFQKELGKRTGTVQVLKRSGRELIENSRDDTTWVKVQLQELSNRWDTVCKLSVSKQTRLEQALKQVSKRLPVEMGVESFAHATGLCPGLQHKHLPWRRCSGHLPLCPGRGNQFPG